MLDIYEKAIKTMKPEHIAHHETDLYLLVNDISRNLVKQYDFRNLVETFISAIPPHVLWYDIPFAYSPGWKKENRYPYTETDPRKGGK